MAEPLDYGDRVDGPTGVGRAASLKPPTDRDGRLHPRNPWIGLLIAALFLTVAVAGIAAIVLEPAIIYASTNRRAGILLFWPLVATIAGAITLVRGLRAIAPWLAHRSVPLALRRQERAADLHGRSFWPLWVFGSLAFVGSAVLAVIFSMYNENQVDLIGRLVQIEILGFLTLVWAACLGLIVQKLYFRRFYAGRDPRGDLPH